MYTIILQQNGQLSTGAAGLYYDPAAERWNPLVYTIILQQNGQLSIRICSKLKIDDVPVRIGIVLRKYVYPARALSHVTKKRADPQCFVTRHEENCKV